MTLNPKAATASALALTRDLAAGTASVETTLRLSTYVNETGIRYAGLPISPT